MSDYLIDQYRQKHLKERTYGHGPKDSEATDIRRVIFDILGDEDFTNRRVLDFGCGTSKLLEYLFPSADIDKTRYDPAIPGLDAEPDGPFAFAICTDVLEHIPEDEVPAFLWNLSQLAHHVFFTVCTTRAVHKLPDGQNAHCTVKPAEWWGEKIAEEFYPHRQHPARRQHAHFFLVGSRHF